MHKEDESTKRLGFNMSQKVGNEFKQATVKIKCNVSCRLLQDKYYIDYNIIIDQFDII